MMHASGWESDRCETCLFSPCRKRCAEQARARHQITCCYEAARIVTRNVRFYLLFGAEKADPRIRGAMGTLAVLRCEIGKLRTLLQAYRAMGLRS